YYRKDNSGPSSFVKYICKFCGKIYGTRGSLKFHRFMECGKEPNFACTFCSYRSIRKSNVLRHIHLVHYQECFIK
ncbi:Longitudinals lacking protein, isoforms A/B/D/L, partial [Trachymyrmex zeteki]